MSLFKSKQEEVVVCSPMEGTITFHGKPVSGAKVERWLKWKDEEGEKDSVVTDENGFFKLPVVKDIVTISPVTQFVMAQEIYVYLKSEKIPVWAKAKREKSLYGELGGKPVNFRCELEDEFMKVESTTGMLLTACKWDEIK